MSNNYEDFDLELSQSMLDDISDVEELEKDETNQIKDDSIKSPKRNPRTIQIFVILCSVLIIIAVIVAWGLKFATSKSDTIVETKNKSTNERIVSTTDVVDKENEKIQLTAKQKKEEDKNTTIKEYTYQDPNTNGVPTTTNENQNNNPTNSGVNPEFNFSDRDVNHTGNEFTYNNANDGKEKPTIIYPSKKGMTVLTNSASNNKDVNNTSNNKDVSNNKKSMDIINNEPKDANQKDGYYSKYLTNQDLINAYNLGLTPEEYYKKYSATGYDFGNKGTVATTNNSNFNMLNNNYREKQTGIKLTESFDEYDIKEGSYIPVVIATNIRSDRPGNFQAIVREDVYDSLNHKYTLIPKGSKIIGVYDGLRNKDDKFINMRVSRIILPNGKSIKLGGFNITDLNGNTGGVGYKDEKYGERLLKSTMTLALGLVSDFVGNSSIGINGFSLGRKNYDYNLNELKVPEEKKADTGTEAPMERIKVNEDGSYITLKETYNIVNTLNKLPLSNEFKDDLNSSYKNTLTKNRNVKENILSYMLAQLIYNKINDAINGKDKENPTTTNNTTNNNHTTNNYNTPNEPNNNDRNILSGLLNGGGGGNPLSNLLGGNNLSNLLGGNNSLDDIGKLSKLFKTDKKEDERELLGTNNIVKDVRSTFDKVQKSWDSVMPVIHIEGGSRLNLYVSSDISLEPYRISK